MVKESLSLESWGGHMVKESLSSESWGGPNLKVLASPSHYLLQFHYTAPNIGWHNFKEFLPPSSSWTIMHQWAGVLDCK